MTRDEAWAASLARRSQSRGETLEMFLSQFRPPWRPMAKRIWEETKVDGNNTNKPQ